MGNHNEISQSWKLLEAYQHFFENRSIDPLLLLFGPAHLIDQLAKVYTVDVLQNHEAVLLFFNTELENLGDGQR